MLIALAIASLLARPGAASERPGVDAVVGGSPAGTSRVIGGGVSVPGRWPSMVALVRAGASSPADRQFCGATVIAPRWVLTAAHCLFDAFGRPVEPSDIRALAGIDDLRAERARESVVTNLFVHPDYDHAAQDAYDDIALLELAVELDIEPVRLFAGDSEALGRAPGVVVGWGATEFATPRRATYPDALHQAVVPLVPRAVCNAPESYAGYVGGGQLCAGFVDGGVDTCVGDSGGPLFVDTGGWIEQVGVVSYGRGCAEPLFYGIYTNIAAYRGWIADYVALADPVVPTDERPRGPVTGVAPVPVGSPGPVPGNGSPFADPVQPVASATLPDDDDGLFGAAFGLPWLLALAGFAVGRVGSRLGSRLGSRPGAPRRDPSPRPHG